jgi:hypothetical protein
MQTYGAVEVKLHAFLTSALDVVEAVPRPGDLHLNKGPRYPLDTRLGGPQSQSWRDEEKIFPCRKLKSGRPYSSLVTAYEISTTKI